jgi:hypothetical protein
LLSIIPLFWAPWSPDWTSSQGARAYRRGDFILAIKWYQRSLNLGQDKVWCWQSIATAYFAAGDNVHYQQTLEFLRKLDQKAADEVESNVRASQK